MPTAATTKHEPMRPIYHGKTMWQGQEWAVTTYRIETRDGSFSIPKEELTKGPPSGGSWIEYVARWYAGGVHAEFITAFMLIRLFAKNPEPNTKTIN
jgi:hypothetical protein